MADIEGTAQRPRRLKLVLLPGLDGTGRLFRWLVEALPAEIEPIVIPLTASADGSYATLEAYVRPLLPVHEPFAILGESFSGPLALRLAARGSEMLAAVILAASFITRPAAWLPAMTRHLVHSPMFRLPVSPLMLQWFVIGADPPAEVLDSAVAVLRSVDPEGLAQRSRAALAVDATADFLQCPVPLLYLGGTRDRLIDPRTVGRLKALRPDLDCVMLDGPHCVLQRAPSAAAGAIATFLRGVRQPA